MGCSVGHAEEVAYADGLDLDRPRSASACFAACATARIAAAAPFPRSSIGWRSIR